MKFNVDVQSPIAEVSSVNCTEDGHDFGGWTNVNKWMCEHGYAVGYWGQNKDDVIGEHWKNRELLAEQGVQELLQCDDN